MENQRACYNCVNGKLEERSLINSRTFEKLDVIKCLREDVSNELFETCETIDCYVNFASKCSYYEPIKIFRCKKCHTIMDVPLWSHKIWGYEIFSGDAMPMCSEKCKMEYDNEHR